VAESKFNNLEEESRFIRAQINDKSSELKTLKSLFWKYHFDVTVTPPVTVPQQIDEFFGDEKLVKLSHEPRPDLIQQQAGPRCDIRQYGAEIRTRELEIQELQFELQKSEAQFKFKTELCKIHLNRVKIFDDERNSIHIRCMVTDCWLPGQDCTATHMIPDLFHVLMSVITTGKFDVNDVHNGVLWAKPINNAFSQNEVCLLYNALAQRLMFFVLKHELLDQVICHDGNHWHAVKFAEVDGKMLDIDATSAPRLKYVLSRANSAIRETRSQIEHGMPKPHHWDTLTTLQSMMEDDANRLPGDPDVVDQNSLDSLSSSLNHRPHDISSSNQITNQGGQVNSQQPKSLTFDERVKQYFRANPKAQSSSFETSDSFDSDDAW
jgi:hypothetical protein